MARSPCQTPTRYGLTPEAWASSADALAGLLERAAAGRSTVTYGEAARVAFGGRFSARSSALMSLLAEVDERALADRGVMVASLVVRADTGRPGEGFFAFAEAVEGRRLIDRDEYWRGQAEAVWSEAESRGAPR